jgi:Zn-dependent protease with chaperone function
MSTNFYERQAAARKTTKWLMAMFTISVTCIVAGVFIATLAAVGYGRHMQEGFELNNPGIPLDDVTLPLGASAGTLALIGCGSLFKIAQLRGGGTTVAENLGGYRVPQNTTDPVERRLINVVEEMAIASGVPVPPVYLLKNEKAINAFAAGYSPSDAVVAVTQGTAEQLTRDQLQGVVAHEFSHILNGDMRLNIRLIGILHGILLMGLIGRMLFNIAARGGGNRRGKNDGTVYLLASGLVLMLLGLLGTIFGNLIKAAVSRQREYLADSSAVQFTRNPEGIAGALKCIGAAVMGSKLANPRAAEMSHMYFGQGVWEGFTGMMATHPPLEKRIHALDPHWNGQYPAMPKVSPVLTESPEGVAPLAGFVAAGVAAAASADEVPVEVVRHSADQVGSPLEMHREYAAKLIEEIPNEILDSARDPYGARAVMFCLLMDKKHIVRNQQLNALNESIPPDVVKLTHKLLPLVDEQDARARLPLVDLSLPALRSMTKEQYTQFRTAFKKLVEADQQISLFEWTLHRVVLRHLKPQFEPVKPPRIQYYNISRLGNEISVLLSTLANLDNTGSRVERSLQHAAGLLPEAQVTLLPIKQCTLDNLKKALATLSTVAPKQRQRIVEAAADLICYDHDVSIKEAELFRGICDMLECPMPPLLPGQPFSKIPLPGTPGRG